MASTARSKSRSEKEEELPLPKATEQLLEECRMVLPGIQALFGFQLIAVFNQGFSTKLTEGMQRLHLAAIVLTVIAIALIMSPAAYQRQTSPRTVSEDFIRLSSRMLVWSMFPLAASISIEVFIVGSIVLKSVWAIAIALAALTLFLGLWFVLPWRRRALTR